MKQFQRRPLLKKAALAGLSIGSVGPLMSCAPSGGDSDSDESAAVGESCLLYTSDAADEE